MSRLGNAQDGAVGDGLEAIWHTLDGFGVSDHQHDASSDAQHSQRGNEGRQLEPCDQQAVENAQDSAHCDADKHG